MVPGVTNLLDAHVAEVRAAAAPAIAGDTPLTVTPMPHIEDFARIQVPPQA